MRTLRRHAIDFASVAGRKHERFFEDSSRAQFFCGLPRLFRRERHPFAHLDRRRAMVQSDENDLHAQPALLEVTMILRQIEVHHSKTHHHDKKIKDTELGGSRSPPRSRLRQLKIKRVKQQHQQGDDVLGIVVPHLSSQPVDPHESKRCADGDRHQPHENARSAHAFEKFKCRKPPYDTAELAAAQKPLLSQENQAKNERKREGRISKNAECDVKSKDYTTRWGG